MRAIDLHHWIADMAPPPTPQDKVDGIMAGDPETDVTGVAVTWLPNRDVLQRAAAKKLNFVIAHEPVFYHHPFYYPYGDEHKVPALDLEQKQSTPPGREKLSLIEEHDLVVYRFHDGWDQFPAYGMGYALADVLGWSDRQIEDNYIYELAPIPLRDLAIDIAEKLDKTGIRFVGNSEQPIRRITLDWGSPGAIDIILKALANHCDAALTGEVIEWRDIEFARDAGIALITGGHCATETPGMQSFYRWFKPQWPELPVEFVDSVDPDKFISANS
jgi:putative NIF3 family GTP cyclohydrolase 1 type 2